MTSTAQLPTRGDPDPPRRREPAERGSLEISPTVIRRIAEYTADSSDDTIRTPRRIVGIGAGSTGSSARVWRDREGVDIALDVGLRYPGSVRDMSATLREDVRHEVSRMTGFHVRSVRITVSALLPESVPRVL